MSTVSMAQSSSPVQNPITSNTSPENSNSSRPQSVGVMMNNNDNVADLPPEMFQSVRSLSNSRTNKSPAAANSTRRRSRRTKQPPPAPQAHPEPRGADEAEVRMMWNRIAPLQDGNKMTTPNDPPLLYSGTVANFLPGGLQDQPSVAALTQQFTDTPRNLLAQARGPLEVFAATGSHPRIGWAVPDNAVLGILTQSAGGQLQLISNRPRTSDGAEGGDANSATADGGGELVLLGGGSATNALLYPHQPLVLFPPTFSSSTSSTREPSQQQQQQQQHSGAGDRSSAMSPSTFLQTRARSLSGRGNVPPAVAGVDPFSASTISSSNNYPFSGSSSQHHHHHPSQQQQVPELIDLIASNNAGINRRSIQQNLGSNNFVAASNAKDDADTILMERHLEECTQWMMDLATAVQNERHLFVQWKADLTNEIKETQLQQAKQQADCSDERQEVQAHQRSQLYLKENDLEKLKAGREKVLDWLTEKKRVLRQLQETSIAVEEAERASTLKLLDVEEDLKKQRGRLEDVLKAKLSSAVDQMAQLSEAQRKARESSTVEDFNRLVKELTEQERKMRELNTTSGKLQHRIGALRREISLESQRGQMLQEKQESYHATISTLVHRLEEIERKYAAQSQRELKGLASSALEQQRQQQPQDGGGAASHQQQLQQQQVKDLPRIIDQQYAVILQLRADLVRVRQEVRQASQVLQQERSTLLQAANPSNQPILSRTATKQDQDQEQESQIHVTMKVPRPPFSIPVPRQPTSSSSSSVTNVVDTMRTSEVNYIKNIVFEALSDADKNLVSVAAANNNIRSRSPTSSMMLPPVYPTLEVLDPVQRRDVFDFVVRRINTKLLNPLSNRAAIGANKNYVANVQATNE